MQMGSVMFYLMDGKPVCCSCIPENHHNNPIPVMRENVHPYSQECSRCFKKCYTGSHDGNMFPVEYSEDVMNKTVMDDYRRQILELIPQHKAEAREVRIKFLERCLHAMIKGKMFLTNEQLIEGMNKLK